MSRRGERSIVAAYPTGYVAKKLRSPNRKQLGERSRRFLAYEIELGIRAALEFGASCAKANFSARSRGP